MTLLQDIIVLAVGNQSVVNPETEETNRRDFVVRKADRPTVTLLVDPDQAETLKLAMHMGSVSLTMRNPMDETPHRGRRNDGSPSSRRSSPRARRRPVARRWKRSDGASARAGAQGSLLASYEMERAAFDREREQTKIEIDRLKMEQQKLGGDPAAGPAHDSEVAARLVIRGGVSETKTRVSIERVAHFRTEQ